MILPAITERGTLSRPDQTQPASSPRNGSTIRNRSAAGWLQWHRSLSLLAAATVAPGNASAEIVPLTVGVQLQRADLLKQGTQRYVRYLIKGEQRTLLDIWTRTISFEQVDGRRLVRVRQRWDGVGPEPTVRVEESLAEAGTMRPISQRRVLIRAGKTISKAYTFDGGGVEGDRSVPESSADGFRKETARPVYNFVPDIEWFRQLPMRAGRVFEADLYDPGSGEPGRYRFKVASSATIAGPDGKPLECWLVTTDYNRPERPETRYWFAKSNQFLIRQEADAGENGRLVKLLLTSEDADGQ